MNKRHFDPDESIHARFDDDAAATIAAIAANYVGRNPPTPYCLRAASADGFGHAPNGRHDLDFGLRFPDAANGQAACALGMVWADRPREMAASINCHGPVQIWLNGQTVFRSGYREEVNFGVGREFPLPFAAGWNLLLVRCLNTPSGFGCVFGAQDPKWTIFTVRSPFAERAGQIGWAFTAPVDRPGLADEGLPERLNLAAAMANEGHTGLDWHPKLAWTGKLRTASPFRRLFGDGPGTMAWAWTSLALPTPAACRLEGETAGPAEIRVNGRTVWSGDAGRVLADLDLEGGIHQLAIRADCRGAGEWGLSLNASVDGQPSSFRLPCPVKGAPGPWLYLGPCSPESLPPSFDPASMHLLHPGLGGDTYWRLDAPELWVRADLESELYGHWNYPLGVTLYGLLKAGRSLGRPDLVAYATGHIRQCVDFHRYAQWDRQKFGATSIDNQLITLDMLDDCGSFGAAMLEAFRDAPDPAVTLIADRIADHMAKDQERLGDGAFYREMKGHSIENTLWVDDLYMSTPFLARYYRLSGNPSHIDDAARQFRLFRNYLFMPETSLMSHVYDLKYRTPTLVPWGRGNGWALYSLSEVLEYLPAHHHERPALLDFFNQLCRGVARHQAESGLWRQVLTHSDAYEETSCTAMFTYAFARGVRFGWLEEPESYAIAALKAWNGLAKTAIDKHGNIHGTCRGSAYSFTPEYYKQELLWVTNDTHGTGIVLQAGIEAGLLTEWLRGRRKPGGVAQ